ncbi:MAG: sulfate permease [Parachlamydiaceae bacterium]|nr:sulfate permease [Parachlamydiaceae bacterium]
MATLSSKFKNYLQDYIPKSVTCFREGYSFKTFVGDLGAGATVGVIALPLAMAFAIGSDVPPERGLFTAIIAGFLISLLGGSRVQIGGPTGAFVIIVFGVIQKFGYEGLAVATFIAGILMILMGLARCGVLLKFIPYPVTTGFTTGIAVSIFSSQIKDFFGLKMDKLPTGFIDKWTCYGHSAHSCEPWAFFVALGTLILIFVLRRLYPRLPAVIIAIVVGTIFTYLVGLPIDTIESKFGGIPRTLPSPSFPNMTWNQIQDVFPDAITIALLAGIESLLSAMVADGMTGYRHRSNCELVAGGFANIGSVFFGGIPATGAIARTTANIKMGAKTPVAGMIHAITLMMLMLLCAPLAAKIPLASLAAVLMFVAWNMSELDHFFGILRSQLSEAIVLVTTFLLTVLIDLTVAVQVGVLLSAILFLKKMTDSTTVKACKVVIDEEEHQAPQLHDSDILFRKDVPADVTVFEITGPFFYGISDLLNEVLKRLPQKPRVFILRMHKVPLVDTTGLQAMKKFALKCREEGIIFRISGIQKDVLAQFKKVKLDELIGDNNFFPNIDAALK